MKGKEAGLFDNKALASLILPLLVEQFLAVLVGMADSIMVASVGEAAVSGVSLVDNVMVLFINLFFCRGCFNSKPPIVLILQVKSKYKR